VSTRITDTGSQDRIIDMARAASTATDPVPANDTATVTTAVVKAPTAMTATPAVAQVLPGLRVFIVRREALCCIPNAVGRNLEECFWVQWLTLIRKV
jgi:hypothetical protein